MSDKETQARPEAKPGHEEGSVSEVAKLALRLGFTAFGGPAAHIAMLRDEVVTRRAWVSDEEFLDLLGATNLIPGPNSTEMVMHIGHARAGWRGLVAAGACFILPAALMVGALAAAYVRYGQMPAAQGMLYGIKPVIIAIIAQALWGLLKTAVKGPLLAVIGLAALALYLAGVNEIVLLLGSGLLVMLLRNLQRPTRRSTRPPSTSIASFALAPALKLFASFSGLGMIAVAGATGKLATLFLLFLKIGSVLYGSGYVLLAFLRNDFVTHLGWLSDKQLLDAVAIGQFTPGPLFTTATFVGYLIGGWPGAVLATVGIFLPSFLLVAAIGPLVPRLRRSPWMSALLDGVNVAALALMAGVAWELGRASLIDPLTIALALGAVLLLIRCKLNSTWLVIAGGLAGLAAQLLRR